jgi:hypothetical protein
MFEIDNTPLKRGYTPMPAGTNENVILTRVAYEPFKNDGTGDNVLKFEFQDDQGRQFTHNEWEIVPDRVKQNAKAWGQDYRELLEATMRDTTERIKHIMSCYMPLKEINVKGSNWTEFAQAVIDNLGDKFNDVPVRIKLILNNKDYTRFPRRAINDFIQLMSQPNSISYHPKYDRIEPKAAAGSSDLDNMFGDDPTEPVVQSREEDEGLVF